jgi:hypothetical protein
LNNFKKIAQQTRVAPPTYNVDLTVPIRGLHSIFHINQSSSTVVDARDRLLQMGFSDAQTAVGEVVGRYI